MLVSPSAMALTTSLTRITPSAPVHNSQSIVFEFTSDRSDVHFVCSLDEADPVICTSPKEYLGLADGSHIFKVFAISAAEGPDYVGATHTWRVDTRPPVTTLQPGQRGPGTISFDLFSDEPNSTFLCSVDGAAMAVCPSSVALSGLTPGPHHFAAFAVDEAMNVDPFGATYNFAIENPNPPTTRILTVVPRADFTNQRSISITFESNVANATFRCTLNGQLSGCFSPWNRSGLVDGLYEFKVQAIDQYGQVDPVGDAYQWVVDTVSPEGTYRQTDTTSTTAIISWTTNEPATTRLEWGADGETNRVWPEDMRLTTEHMVRVTGLSSYSNYSFKAGGVDRAGNPHTMGKVTLKTKR